jgi:Na+:H+ antiporter, NhaA family
MSHFRQPIATDYKDGRQSYKVLCSTMRVGAASHADAAGIAQVGPPRGVIASMQKPALVLMLAAAIALAWANSPWAAAYHALWHWPVPLLPQGVLPDPSLHFWINDALMTIFFLVVGMEIRYEMQAGSLADARQAALPLLAAAGGIAVPALIYLGFNGETLRRPGWAVPTATDIAFALGALAMLGKSIPANVRVFLLALAIVDDIAAILIIALVYSAGLDYAGMGIAAAGVFLLLGMQRLGVGRAWAYVVPGTIIWWGFLRTGLHPTLAGVLVGMLTPLHAARSVPHALHPWVAFGVMPLFAVANAGVSISGIEMNQDAMLVLAGVVVALLVGKPLGVIGISWIAVRLGWCRLPAGVDWRGIVLVGLLAGIGFTMSIFVAMLAFADANLLAAAKLGVLIGTGMAGALGIAWGVRYARSLRLATDQADWR